jgi:small subunit ribosomal protein S20
MANHPSALKRIRQNAERRLRNKSYRTIVKNAIKQYLAAVNNKEQDVQNRLNQAVSLLQKGVSKGVYHQNTASRTIARLSKKLPAA